MRFLKYLCTVLCLMLSISVYSQRLVVKSPLRFLALGDSYTIGQGVPVADRWPEQLVKRLETLGVETEKLSLIAQTGWRTDNLLTAIARENPDPDYNLVSLLIGVNNQYQGKAINRYPAEFRQLLQKAIDLCGGTKEGVFVLSIPDYGYTPFGAAEQAAISAEIDNYNDINQQIASQFGVAYYNITPISREAASRPEYLAPDQLHPSGEMYARWVSLIVTNSAIELLTSSAEHKQQTQEVIVYPTPARNKLTLLLPPNAHTLTIYHSLGRRVYQAALSTRQKVDIDVAVWQRGLYFYRIRKNNGTTVSGKIIVS